MKKVIDTKGFDKKPAHEKKIIFFMIASLFLVMVFCDIASRYNNVYLLAIGAFFLGTLFGGMFVGRIYRNLDSLNPAGEKRHDDEDRKCSEGVAGALDGERPRANE